MTHTAIEVSGLLTIAALFIGLREMVRRGV